MFFASMAEISVSYKIVDVLGRTVISGKTTDHNLLTLDISSIPRGMYSVLVERADLKGFFANVGKFSAIDR